MPVTDPFKVPAEVRAGPAAVPRDPRHPQVKACPKAQAYEPHPGHNWEKRAGWTLACEGVPEVADQPPCSWINESDGKMCGAPAPVAIRARTALVDAKIMLCRFHKRKHDNMAANRRSSKPDAQAS